MTVSATKSIITEKESNSKPVTVTLKHLAEELDLGITTVSDILLRGKTNYRDSTIQRVKKTAARLGYRPNALAQGFRSGRTKTIGLVITFNILDPFFAELVNRLEEKFEAEGFMVLLSISENDIDKDRRAIDFLESRRVDGIIIGPVYKHMGIESFYDQYTSNTPTVMFLADDDAPVDSVNIKGGHRGIGQKIVNYFLDHGHSRIGYLMCPEHPQKDIGSQSFRGFYETLEPRNLYNEDWVWIAERPLPEIGYEKMKAILKRYKSEDLPTAIYCHNDHSAIGAMAAIREAGYKVPDDFSLIGTDNIITSAYTDPPLTTIDLRPKAIADATFAIMSNKLNAPDTQTLPTDEVLYRCLLSRFVERESVKTIS